MMPSLRHDTSWWGSFLLLLKVQTNIYQMEACNEFHLEQFSSYIQLEKSPFAVFGRRELEERERERESQESRVDGFLNEDPGPLPGPICFSALAESSSGRCGTFLYDCWMMLRVDGCLNEDPGPLPGPR